MIEEKAETPKKATPKEATPADINKLRKQAGTILSEIKNNTVQLYQSTNKPFDRGGYNTIFESKKALDVDGNAKSKNASQPLVISYTGGIEKPDNAAIQGILANKARSQALLDRAGLFSPFVINPYYTRSSGRQFSPMAAGGNFWNLINTFYDRREKIPAELAKQIVGQIILALEDTHGKGVANRDLKPENVLLWEKFKFAGRATPNSQAAQAILIALCDTESFEQINEDGHLVNTKSAISGSEDYIHPTIKKLLSRRDYAGYRQLDHRKCDLYSLGKIIEVLVVGRKVPISWQFPLGKLPPLLANDTRQNKIIFAQFKQLYDMLCKPDLASIPGLKTVRRTEEVILDNQRIEQVDSEQQEYSDLRSLPLFGRPEQGREFFQRLHTKAKAARNITSGGFQVGHPVAIGDPFNLIPAGMKPIYDQFDHLASQIIGILHYQTNSDQVGAQMISSLLVEMCQSFEAFSELVNGYGGSAKSRAAQTHQDVVPMCNWVFRAMQYEPFLEARAQWENFKKLPKESDIYETQATKIRRLLKDKNLDQAEQELENFKKDVTAFSNGTAVVKQKFPLFVDFYTTMQARLEQTHEHLTKWLAAEKHIHTLRQQKEAIAPNTQVDSLERDKRFDNLDNHFNELANQMLAILSYQAQQRGRVGIGISSLLVEMCQSHEAFLNLIGDYDSIAKDRVEKMQQWINEVMQDELFSTVKVQEQWEKFADLRQQSDALKKQAQEIDTLIEKENFNEANRELAVFKAQAAAFSDPNKTKLKKQQCPLFADVIATLQQEAAEVAEDLSNRVEKKPPSKWPKRLFKLYQYVSPLSSIAVAALIVSGVISGPIGWIALAGLAAVMLTTNVYLSTGWKRVLSGLLLLLAVGACVVMILGLLSNPAGWLMLLLTVMLPTIVLTLWTGFVNYQHSQQIEVLEDSLQPLEVALPDLESASSLTHTNPSPDATSQPTVIPSGNKAGPLSKLKSNDSKKLPISIIVNKITDGSIPEESKQNNPNNPPLQKSDNLDNSESSFVASTVRTNSSSEQSLPRRLSDSSIRSTTLGSNTLTALQSRQAFDYTSPRPHTDSTLSTESHESPSPPMLPNNGEDTSNNPSMVSDTRNSTNVH